MARKIYRNTRTEEDLPGGLKLIVERTEWVPKSDIDRIDHGLPVRYYLPEIHTLIRRVKPEIETLWRGMKKILGKGYTWESENYLDMQRKAALDCYNNHNFGYLREEYFRDEITHLFAKEVKGEYPNIKNVKRDFVGKLLQVIIFDHYPDVLLDPKHPPKIFGFQPLYELYCKR